MQPKFTRKKLRFFGMRAIVTSMAFMFMVLTGFSQNEKSEYQRMEQLQLEMSLKPNDAGRPAAAAVANPTSINAARIISTQRTEAVCATYNGTLGAGDATLGGGRMFRDGIASTCAVPKPGCPGAPFGGAGNWYDTYTFTNSQAASQCVTVRLTNNTAGFVNFATVYNGSFNPNDVCANYLADVGGSPDLGQTLDFSFTLPGSATVTIVVSSVTVGTGSSYTLVVDGICAPCVPNNATMPVISSVPSSTCAGSPITLSLIGGQLNGAAEWRWYTGSCGGTLVGTGASITVSPAATTTYYVRGEGGCAPAPGPCGQQTVTVTACTCLIPDVATICEGSIQRIQVAPSGASTSTFSTATPITIPGTGTGPGVSNPYPGTVTVSGLPTAGGVYVESVTINGLSHTWPSDIDMVLVSPNGTARILMSDAGGSTDAVNANVTFSDAGATFPATVVSGTFKPINAAGPDNFPAPGPGNITNVNPTLASFSPAMGDPNGDWKLFIYDQAGGDAGSLSGGWSITFRIVPVATWTQSPASPNSIFTDALATIPYVSGSATDVVWVKPATTTTYTANISSGPCAGNNNVTVTVLPRPTISIAGGGGCSPATLVASGAVNYQWSPTGGLNTSTGSTVIATVGANTVYTVTGYAANGCSNTATATVNAAPTSAVITAPPAFTTLLSEGFDAAVPLPTGWAQQNLSTPIGTNPTWVQGTTPFPAQTGAATSYICTNFNAVAGSNTISNWLFTPQMTVQNGDQLTFYARSINAGFPDRLQVRMSTSGASVNVGASNTSVGDFTNLLLDINPTYNTTAFPNVWTLHTLTVSGLAGPTSVRFAFRYFVESGGPSGANSDFIGVDQVEVKRPLAGVCANTVSTIAVNITGGVAPYTLVYTNGSTQTTYNNYVSGTPIQVSPATTTTYTIVSVVGANGCASASNSGSATINVVPGPSISSQPANSTVCTGGTATFSVTTSPATGNTYQWQVSTNGGGTYTNLANGGGYSGVTTSLLTVSGVTTAMNGYRYRVVVGGQCPPSPITSTAGILTVNVPPTITTQPAATIARCVGTTATLSVVATGNSPTYQWQVSIDGGLTYTNISGATSATLTLAGVTQSMNNNRYRVVVTVAPCATTVTSNASLLTVNPLPVVTVTATDLALTPGQTSTITASSTPAATSYSWTLNGSTISGATTNTVTATIDGLGTYVATATDANGCTASSNALVIGGEASDRLWIYPNPSSGQFQVRLYNSGNPTERRVVTIYSSKGQRLMEKQFTLDNINGPYLRMDFDMSKFAKGTYVVRVIDRQRSDKPVASGLVVIQ